MQPFTSVSGKILFVHHFKRLNFPLFAHETRPEKLSWRERDSHPVSIQGPLKAAYPADRHRQSQPPVHFSHFFQESRHPKPNPPPPPQNSSWVTSSWLRLTTRHHCFRVAHLWGEKTHQTFWLTDESGPKIFKKCRRLTLLLLLSGLVLDLLPRSGLE